jgi:hypothetical protein
MKKIKLAKDIPIKKTIGTNDYFLSSGVLTRNGVRFNKDFLTSASDLIEKVSSKKYIDLLEKFLKQSPNIKINRSGNTLYPYWQDDALNARFLFFIEKFIETISVVNSFIASKTASFGDALQRELDTEQFIRNEITNQLQVIKDALEPIDLISIFDAEDSNIELGQINGRFTLNIEDDIPANSFSFDIREAHVEKILAKTTFEMSIAHLDLTPSCEPIIGNSLFTPNSNKMISFNHQCYLYTSEYQYKVKNSVLKLAYQETTNPHDESFQYRTAIDTGYFQILKNSQHILARRDLTNMTFLETTNPICTHKDENNIFVFGSTILFGIHSLSFINTPSSYYFSIFSFYDSDKITLYYQDNAFILDVNGSMISVNIESLNKNENINIGISFNFDGLNQSIILQIYQKNAKLEASGSFSRNIFKKIIDTEKKYVIGFIADESWYCSGITIFSDGLSSSQMTQYFSDLYLI